MLDFSKIKTYSIARRRNKFSLADLKRPGDPAPETVGSPELARLAERIVAARKNDRPVIWMMGAHLIKLGLSPFVLDLLDRKILTHVATNGATTIHDFEVALLGATSENVAVTIVDGSFGMAEETGRDMNAAIKRGVENKWGMGYALGRWIAEHNLPHREWSILNRAYELQVPFTVHVSIGTDIIYQHPTCDGAALGATSYQDFKLFTESVSQLEGGVVLNVGSSVLMPEVFLKALSVARNLGCTVSHLTTANLDMIDHYRPRENVLTRPTSLGGQGIFIQGRHEVTIPSLHQLITNSKN